MIVKSDWSHNFMDTAKVKVPVFTPKAFCEGTATKSVKMLGLTYRQEEELIGCFYFLLQKETPFTRLP